MEHYNIYPKQFRSAKIPIEKNRCFILMPFDSKFDIIYGNIKQSLNDKGFICNRADEIIGSKPIMNKILNEIMKSQYIIADLSNSNPNVFYELGIAHSFKDSRNIILLKQKGEKIPFDITHLNHIVYEANNLKFLTSNINNTLDDNKYVYSFYESLQSRGIISFIDENKKDFIDYLQINLDEYIPLISNLLLGIDDLRNEHDIEELLNKLLYLLNKTIEIYKHDYLDGVIQFLFEILLSSSKYRISDKIIYDFLFNNLLSRYPISEVDIISYQTDLAILFASNGVKVNTVMKWLIDYLSRSKSSTIDLNRYKIERFFMLTNDKKIDSIIIDSIFHKNCYIREHLADICGEKNLADAGETLSIQLLSEKNYFTATSLISAIGKLRYDKGASAILKWISNNEEEIIKTKQFFVLKHIRIALTKLDKEFKTSKVENFDEKFKKYLENYFIL